ncbi:NUDIX domain-containing protein [Pacificoceanicola onchidii]|uniref:NUDIX domain-containing protein n=1 Tax=Pacificoceanicola onchidii TaxID=2562685 RepID=UPI0010A35F92|nr:NUDIX hydrolase [Pacificoceanicola onchidii]
MPSPRLACRAVILLESKLLLVNAWPGNQSDLWCAPGGGVERGSSLPENLAREVFEETGLTVTVGTPCLINEFHDPRSSFHQVEVFFRCTITSGAVTDDWQDPEGIVHKRRWFTQAEVAQLHLKPDSLRTIPWSEEVRYDPLEALVK